MSATNTKDAIWLIYEANGSNDISPLQALISGHFILCEDPKNKLKSTHHFPSSIIIVNLKSSEPPRCMDLCHFYLLCRSEMDNNQNRQRFDAYTSRVQCHLREA